MKKRFSQGHPMRDKMDELFECMHKLGIHLSVQAGETFVIDDAGVYPVTRLSDQETDEGITEFPSAYEYKLTFTAEEKQYA
jgi:hypothetical protein